MPRKSKKSTKKLDVVKANRFDPSALATNRAGALAAGQKSRLTIRLASMAFSSIEGKIDVTFPADVKAYVKMKSDNGDIFSDFDIEIDKRKTQVNKSDKTGVYKISLEDWTNGKINGGGPEILLKTLEGNIYIRKGK